MFNAPQPSAQMPSFGGSSPQAASPAMAPAQQTQGATQASNEDVEVHKTVQEIQDRLATAPREAQQFLTKAIASIPALPTIMGIIIGPEAQDFFTQAQQAVQQQMQAQQGQQNSPAATPSMAPAAQNPQAPQGAGGSPAMATSAAPQGQ